MNKFETDNLDLAAFLMLHDVEFVGCEVKIDVKKRKPKAIMKFKDSKQNARDLERLFITSGEKRYRDLTKYLLKQVHKAVRDFSNEILESEEV